MRGILPLSSLALALALVAGCAPSKGAEATEAPVEAPSAIPVRVRDLQATRQPRIERRTGRAEPERQVTLAFGTPGRVQVVKPAEGDRVKKGALLASIDTKPLEAALESARAAVEQAEREHGRAERLKDNRALPQQVLDERGSQLRMARAQLAGAEAQLAEARIFAPFDADVVRRNVEPGAWAAPGVPMLQLAVLDPIRVVAQVTAESRVYIREGATVEVRTPSIDGVRTGRVVRVAPVTDAQTGLFRVEIEVDNADRRIAGGQPVEVTIDCGVQEDIFLLEPEWLVYRYDGPSVVMLEQGRARTVVLGDALFRSGQQFVVPAASLPKLPLIVSGQHVVREGGPVRLVESEER